MTEKSVEAFMAELEGWQREAAEQLRRLVKLAAPEATEALKWSQPVFQANGPFCYIQSHSNHLNIGFWRGVDLTDEQGLLEGSGAKMRHLKIHEAQPIPEEALQAFVQQAYQLNLERGDPTRG